MNDDLCVGPIDVRVDHCSSTGVVEPEGGALRPAGDRPGLGLSLKEQDAQPYGVA